jgi:cobaltochelatase CobS
MEKNEVIQQVINTIRKDILSNKEFLSEILKGIELKPENVSPELIIKVMSMLGQEKAAPMPKKNAPEATEKETAPVKISADSLQSKIVSDLLEGNNVYLRGKAGTGKTYLAKSIARYVMGQDIFQINCSQWTSPINIIGGQTIEGYVEGELVKAWALGGILILDELPKLDPNTAGLLNETLAEAASPPIYDAEGNVKEDKLPYITNGRGEKIYKGEWAKGKENRFRFCVIGTGNTDMMNVGNRYSGNQRQDYSLVDRFAGSFYTIEEDPVSEKNLTYSWVFNAANAIRLFLKTKPDAIVSISIRTMLNFNRTYEQEMLSAIRSPYADIIFDNEGAKVPPKSVDDSLKSFREMMDEQMQKDLLNFPEYREAIETPKDPIQFKKEFKLKYHLDPITQKPLSKEELEVLYKS